MSERDRPDYTNAAVVIAGIAAGVVLIVTGHEDRLGWLLLLVIFL